MTGPANCQLLGRWRIVESDLWDAEYLDLVAPAEISFDVNGRGELAFGALQAGMALEYGRVIIFFNFEGLDEGDEIRGTGSAELTDASNLEVALSFFHGDDAVLIARKA